MKNEKFELEWGGKKLIVSSGKLALQANSSVVVQYGDSMILATVVMGKEPREGISYFPLMVDYEEKLYAAGKIKGSRFIKREGKPSDEAVLTARLIDRSIRPLFDEAVRNDIQVILTVLSVDQENDPDIPALVAASAVLSISDIPWIGPIGGIRVGRVDGEFVINPSYEDRAKSDLDLVVAGTSEKVVMIEAGANEVSEEDMTEAIFFGQKHLGDVVGLIEKVQKEIGQKKSDVTTAEEIIEEEDEEEGESPANREALINKTEDWLKDKLSKALFDTTLTTKISRKEALKKLKEELDEYLKSEQIGKDKRKEMIKLVDPKAEAEITRGIIEEEKRVDGRKLTEIRTLISEVGLLPRTHGSGLFNRGETQILSVVTLGSPGDEQTLDGMEENGKKRYMHHYNFPPFSVGEVSPSRWPGRREIGHGALAEKALIPVLPEKEKFPYTIRVVSEVLGSNGSSSMGSVCGSTLSLMDAGVPIKSPVAGIAMGLASDGDGKYKILTDLQDLEDGQGGMDFKIAGTRKGITAIQMDTKTLGLTQNIVKETFIQGKEARLEILGVIEKTIKNPREKLSPYAPQIITLKINPDKIRTVIGPGGKIINEIIDATGVAIDIEDDGLVMITAPTQEGADRAVEWVKNLTAEPEVGKIYEGKVTRILDFGAFVEILPKQEGLVHISELAPERINKVEDIVKEGQIVKVKLVNIDDQKRLNLSIKRADPNYKEDPSNDNFDRPRRPQNRGPRNNNRDRRKKF